MIAIRVAGASGLLRALLNPRLIMALVLLGGAAARSWRERRWREFRRRRNAERRARTADGRLEILPEETEGAPDARDA